MKTNLSKSLKFFLVILVVLITCSVSASAQALENAPRSIANATIVFLNSEGDEYSGSFEYDGSTIWKPDVFVTLDGLNCILPHCTVSYNSGKDAGMYSVTVTGDGSTYTDSVTKQYEVQKRTLNSETIRLATNPCSKEYDGYPSAHPSLLIDGILTGDDVTVNYKSASYATSSGVPNRFVGNEKSINVKGLTLSGKDANNYQLSTDEITLKNCGAIFPIEPQITPHAEVKAGGNRLDLGSLVSGYRGNDYLHFLLDPKAANGCQLNGWTLISGSTIGQVTVEVSVDPLDVDGDGTSEYASKLGYITITITDAEDNSGIPDSSGNTGDSTTPTTPDTPGTDTETGTKRQDPLVITGSSSMTYGQRLDLGVVGGSGSGAVTYAITGGTGSGTIDQNGRLQAAKVGTIWVTAFKAGDQTYQMRQSDAKVITVSPAKLTVTAPSKTIRVGEAVPDLAGLNCTVSGLVGSDRLRTSPSLVYASTPDAGKAGTVAIHPFGAEVPAGGNYQPDITYLSGSLTIQEEKDFPITIHPAANGTLSSDHPRAEEGATVLLTATAREGFVPEPPIVTYQNLRLVVASQGAGLYAFSMPGGPVTVTPAFVPGPPEPEGDSPAFSDVHGSDWFSDSVAYVCRHGLMVGTDERSFSPNGITTRGMLVTILYRTEGEPAASNQSHYADVPPSAYYASPVSWASWHGIASGYSADAFGPEDSISRQQLATILYRYAAYKNFDVSHRGNLVQFSDRDQISDYAIDALSWANATGLLNGKADQTLAPAASTTRAEMAAILQRFCEKYALF